MINTLKWWVILTFPCKWGSRYITSLFERPPFNGCLFDYDEVFVSPCSVKELNDMFFVNWGIVRMHKPDFGGIPKINLTGREYVPYIGFLSIPINEAKEK